VDFDPVSGGPKTVSTTDGFLSGPKGVGKAVSAALASGIAADDPYRATKAFLKAHTKLFGHGPEALDQARVSRAYVTPHNGLQTVVWEQQVGGVAVFEGLLISHTTRQGELVSIASQFLPDPVKAAGQAAAAVPGIPAAQALALAARNVGDDLAAEKIRSAGQGTGSEQRQKFTAPGLKGEAETKLIWLPLDKQTLRLCWDVILMSRARGEMFRILVDGQTGEALLRRCLTSYLTDASYRVFTSDSPSPLSPGYSTPVSTQPPLVERTLVTLAALDTNASPAGWIGDGGNETLGNNVDSHTDINADNQPDLPRPQGSPSRVFDFPMDLTTQDPTAYSSAAAVQLFYLCNVYHDRLYQLGFTEAAGNFQSNNFARGGFDNDPVTADAQDGSGTDNANFSTPPDGSSGRMQMYIFSGPSPRRDGDFDAEVVFHEHTHGLSWRLVGGGQALGDTQSDGMGEGWSDFYALCLLSEAGDDVNGNYACGGYASYQIGGAGDTSSYYFGIRRYPYTTDMTRNPLTFKDIDPAQADYCASGAPYHTGMFGSCGTADAREVHNEGEVWCVTLWDARANLVNKHGWAVGNQLVLQLVTDGMKLTPMHPNFLQARDAIIQADLVDTGGANQHELWAAFAKRGMGFSATSPASSTTTGIHEAFDVPDDLRITPLVGFVANGPEGGPFTPGTMSLVLTNIGTNSLSWTAVNPSTWLSLSPTSGTVSPGGPAASLTASLTAAANSQPMGIYMATVWFTNLDNLVAQSRQFTLRVGQPDYYTEIFDTSATNLAFQAFTFTPNGSSSFYGVCRQPATTFFTDPTGGTAVPLTDDSFATATVADGNTVGIYGTRSSVFYIGSNGYLTMNVGDTYMVESLATHFNLPRVAALFHDLNPAAGGSVSWKQLADRVAVTYQAVPVYAASALTNSFQIELFFDGRIRLTYLGVKVPGALAGLSAGMGVPTSFTASDFTAFNSCAPLQVVLPASVAENAGVLPNAGAIWLGSILPTNLTVSLSSSEESRLTVPATATVLAGQPNATFDLTLGDNAVHDGNHIVTITASTDDFINASNAVLVIDDDTPPLIAVQPASQTIIASNSVTFSVTATGKPPLYFSWNRNGNPIPGATASSYTTDSVQLADSGSLFSCLVSNSFGTALSSNAVLSVVTNPPDWFTEWFDGSPHTNDIAYQMFTFTPDASANSYTVCRLPVNAFPTDPTGGTTVFLTDDSYAQVTLTGTNTVAIYNRRTNVFFIGSNGYLTMDSADTTWTASYANHFNRPRVAGVFRDLNPGAGGTVSWQQLGDRVAVTYQNVLQYNSTYANSFQMELFFDGRIRLTYLQLGSSDGLVGLSAGLGQPTLFTPSDFSTYSACVVEPPFIVNQPQSRSVAAGAPATFTVGAVGSPSLSYRWRQRGTNVADGGKVSGAASANLVVSNVQVGEMADYSVVVSNSYGSVTSAPAWLYLWPLVGWGPDMYGQTDIPAGLSNVMSIAAGFYHCLAAKADGTVMAWGAGKTNSGITPNFGQALVPAGLSNVVSVARGYYHSLALKADGTLAAWGAGLTNAQATPNWGQCLMPAGLSNLMAVAGGGYHTLALRSDGTVLAWGAGLTSGGPSPSYGQALVPAGLSNVVAIAGGAYHSLALGDNGVVTAWGAGTTSTGANPHFGQSVVPAGLSNVMAIAAGSYHSLALKADGTVVAWGAGVTNTGTTPNYGQAIVPLGLNNVVAITAGSLHSMALRADGTLVAWGAGMTASGTTPNFGQALVPAGVSKVVALAGGGYHTLVLEGDGSPHITVQPLSRITSPGANVAFMAAAVGNQPLSYQWQCNGTNLTDNAHLAGSHSSVLTLNNVAGADTAPYQLVVTNTYGSAASLLATLIVKSPAPSPLFQLSGLSEFNGTIFFAWAAGAGHQYQVQYKTDLIDTNWLNLGSPIMAAGPTASATDPATNAQRFYRIVLLP
jgi:alpha-tubulin suppressor-like RCC1 family protein